MILFGFLPNVDWNRSNPDYYRIFVVAFDVCWLVFHWWINVRFTCTIRNPSSIIISSGIQFGILSRWFKLICELVAFKWISACLRYVFGVIWCELASFWSVFVCNRSFFVFTRVFFVFTRAFSVFLFFSAPVWFLLTVVLFEFWSNLFMLVTFNLNLSRFVFIHLNLNVFPSVPFIIRPTFLNVYTIISFIILFTLHSTHTHRAKQNGFKFSGSSLHTQTEFILLFLSTRAVEKSHLFLEHELTQLFTSTVKYHHTFSFMLSPLALQKCNGSSSRSSGGLKNQHTAHS